MKTTLVAGQSVMVVGRAKALKPFVGKVGVVQTVAPTFVSARNADVSAIVKIDGCVYLVPLANLVAA